MSMMRKFATPSMTAVTLLAGMSFAMAQGAGAGGSAGGAGGGTDSPSAESNPADAGTAAKPLKKHKRHKATHRAKAQSTPKDGKPLGPTNTKS